jgi:hypothetical protein
MNPAWGERGRSAADMYVRSRASNQRPHVAHQALLCSDPMASAACENSHDLSPAGQQLKALEECEQSIRISDHDLHDRGRTCKT